MQWLINIGSNYLRFIASMLAVFFMTPYVIDKLGVEQFGLWTLLYAIAGLFGLMDFGFATAAVRYVAEATGRGDEEARNRALSTLLPIYLAIGLLALSLLAILAAPIREWLDLTVEQQVQFNRVYWLLGIAVACNFPASLFKAAMSGAGRMSVVNSFDVLMVGINVTLTVTLLEAGYGIAGLALSTAVTLLGTSLAMIPLSFMLLPRLTLSWRLFDPRQTRPMLAFSGYAFVANIALVVSLRLDPVIIKLFMPLSAIALYGVAVRISEYVYLLNKQFSNALMPLISQLHGRGDNASIHAIMVDGTRYLLVLALPAIALLFHHAPALLQCWLGPDFAAASPLLRLLLIALLPAILQLNAANVLGMTGRHRFLAYCMLASALLNFLISLVGVWLFGLTGAALGTLLAVLLVDLAWVLPAACRHIGLKPRAFLQQAVLPTLPALVPLTLSIWVLDTLLGSDNFGTLFLKMILAGLIYVAAFAVTGLKATERAWLLQQAHKLRPAKRIVEKPSC